VVNVVNRPAGHFTRTRARGEGSTACHRHTKNRPAMKCAGRL
jgi:hypothetical protein